MALAITGTTTRGTSTGTSSLSFSKEVPSGSDLLTVQISHSRGADSVSGVTFNGDAMTRAIHSSANVGAYIYYLANPDIATGNVIVSISAGSDRALVATAVSWSGADTSDPIGGTAGVQGDSTTPSIAVNTEGTNSIVIDAVTGLNLNIMTEGAGQTVITNQVQVGTAQSEVAGSSYEAAASPSSITMSWTMAGSAQWDICAAELKISAVAGVSRDARLLSLLGVG